MKTRRDKNFKDNKLDYTNYLDTLVKGNKLDTLFRRYKLDTFMAYSTPYRVRKVYIILLDTLFRRHKLDTWIKNTLKQIII